MNRRNKKIVMFYPNVNPQVIEAVRHVLQSRWIGQGDKVDEFESVIRQAFDIPYAVAVNCGSAALRLALSIAGVGPGDEVITSPQCCTATNHPILEQFAKPVFADIQYLTGNINPEDVEKRITDKTKAVIGVDLGGYPCDADELMSITNRHGIAFVQDSSDSIGALSKGKFIGTIARFTAFSFGAVQQLSTGEGGMLCCLNENDAEAGQRRRWYGIDRKRRKPTINGYYDFNITETGYGYHMTNIAASIGMVNLANLKHVLSRRAKIVERYLTGLSKVSGIELFKYQKDVTPAYQLFTIHVENRNEFCMMMQNKGIEVSIVHARNDQYSVFGGRRDDLPVLDRYENTNISLPLHNKLSDEDVDYIIQSMKEGW